MIVFSSHSNMLLVEMSVTGYSISKKSNLHILRVKRIHFFFQLFLSFVVQMTLIYLYLKGIILDRDLKESSYLHTNIGIPFCPILYSTIKESTHSSKPFMNSHYSMNLNKIDLLAVGEYCPLTCSVMGQSGRAFSHL